MIEQKIAAIERVGNGLKTSLQTSDGVSYEAYRWYCDVPVSTYITLLARSGEQKFMIYYRSAKGWVAFTPYTGPFEKVYKLGNLEAQKFDALLEESQREIIKD